MDMANWPTTLPSFLRSKSQVFASIFLPRVVSAASRGLFFLFTVPVLHAVRPFLAIRTCQLLVEHIQAVGLGGDTRPGGQFCACSELRFRDIELPSAYDRVCRESRAGEEESGEHDE
jgi:hypothetical protein